MTAPVPLHFSRTTDRDVHGDLLLKLGVWRHVCDSYYLAIDETHGAGLGRLLDQWLEQLERLRVLGRPVFLPFDFSDQCTAWLRVSSAGGSRVVVEAGWSMIEGWSFYPSDIAETASRIDDFAPIHNTDIECDLDDLVASVSHQRAELGTVRSAADGAA
ncbi:hypothetical protein ACFV4P_29090 [Kitasatospora sp. NPDC059795]|uniref:hypothetical protein n=1 Tax=Kitasatospora sp. NPDC059795 TaxID=3346949 RepID=UPI00365924CA